MCRLGQGEAREWSAVARRSHRGADRADIVFRFRSSLALPKMEVAHHDWRGPALGVPGYVVFGKSEFYSL